LVGRGPQDPIKPTLLARTTKSFSLVLLEVVDQEAGDTYSMPKVEIVNHQDAHSILGPLVLLQILVELETSPSLPNDCIPEQSQPYPPTRLCRSGYYDRRCLSSMFYWYAQAPDLLSVV
jgi:hypothetical protein